MSLSTKIQGSMERSISMPPTGKDVWDATVKAGLLRGPYDPGRNPHCANADVLAALLNEVLNRRDNWLPNLLRPRTQCASGKPVRPGSPYFGSTSSSTNSAIRSSEST